MHECPDCGQACACDGEDMWNAASECEPEPEDDAPYLGPCCVCETEAGVHNIIMLDRQAVMSGHGWGCLVCGLASDGAMAVLCDPCLKAWQADNSILKIACRGYPAKDGRVAIDVLPIFKHREDIDHGC